MEAKPINGTHPSDNHRAGGSFRRLAHLVGKAFNAELAPTDLDDEARGTERDRRALLGVGSAILARGFSLLLSLVTVPLTLHYLGTERYGMWVTMSSLIALLSVSDLGIGYGLLNATTDSLARGDIRQARVQISSAAAMLVGLVALLAVIFAVVYPRVEWYRIFAVTSALAAREAAPATAAFVCIFLIGIPLSVATQVRVARQEVFIVHLTATLGNVAALGALLMIIVLKGGVPALIFAMSGPPLLAFAVNAGLLFMRDAPHLRPGIRLISLSSGLNLMQIGFLFLVLQMSTTVAFATDSIVLAQLLGPAAVSDYSVAFRLFSIPVGLATVAATPLWPAYGDAVSRGDIPWVRRTLRRSLAVSLAVTLPAAFVLTSWGSRIIEIWVGPAVHPSIFLLAGFALWGVFGSVGHSVAIFLNGANQVRWQAAAAALMACANIGLSIWFTIRIGVAGVVWGTVVTYGLLVLLPMALYVPKILRRLQI